MKRIVFLIIATLLVIGLVLPGCGGNGEEPEVLYTFEGGVIKIAIAGPMEYIQGEHMMAGAELAAAEINVGGVDIGGETHTISLIEVETKEIAQPFPGYSAQQVENAITVQGADFVMGGFRTEATGPMIEAAMDEKTMFFVAGSATGSLLEQVNDNYAKYKYLFRATPINESFLFLNTMAMLGMVGYTLMSEAVLNTTDPADIRVAFVAEDLLWTQVPIANVGLAIAALNFTFLGTQTVSDTDTDISTELNIIEGQDANIIFTFLSGPVGVTYGKQMGSLEVPALSLGINVEGQSPTFWGDTEYEAGKFGAESMMSLMTWAPNIEQTALTADFTDAFQAANDGAFPIYTAATYDMIYSLVAAIEDEATYDTVEAVGSVLADDLIAWFENPVNKRTTTSGTVGYYTLAHAGLLPYGVPCYAHDLMYGPQWATGLGVQWQNDGEDNGLAVGIWPKANFGDLTQSLIPVSGTLGLNWSGFEWPGTEMFDIPTWMVIAWLTP